jgi:bifunctional non-homologous end joining protein LigD
MGLTEYRRKRDFRVTAEPRGRRGRASDRLRYVIQKHDASHLHYDFRLELGGVLVSWAVPKGPSLDPAVKRLAMHVEDHPIEYGTFEGIIPAGEYGGGAVLIWDQGTWEPVGDAKKGLREGSLKFTLHGKKLRGRWMLVRRGGKRSEPGERAWFLFKERDEYSDPSVDVTEKMPLSVASGRDLDAIATSADRVWGPGGEGSDARNKKAKPVKSKTAKPKANRGKNNSDGRAAKKTRRAASVATRAPSAANEAYGEVAGVRLSHPDKILYPADGITKLDLAQYYEQVADRMLPLVVNRLISLVRCPAGSGQKCFFQKHPGKGAFEELRRYRVREKTATEEYLVIQKLSDVISLVQMSVLEIHVWGSRADQIEKPDRLIFDLDPDETVDWPRVVAAAKEVRLLLEEIGLVSFLKTTGGKGLHVVVPIQRRTSWEDAKSFCRAVADFLVAAAPDRYIATMSKAARKGKIFVDYLRNDRGATSIAPYSTRARAGGTVSTPIAWDELNGRLHSDQFTVTNLPARLARLKNDPWADLSEVRQSITASMLRQLELRSKDR